MTIDHDAIAARVWQDRETGTPGVWDAAIESGCHAIVAAILPDGANIIALIGNSLETPERETMRFANARRIAALPDLEAAYLDLYDEVQRLLAALDDIAAAAFWIANEIHIGPEDEGRALYDMALAIRDDARAAMKGDTK